MNWKQTKAYLKEHPQKVDPSFSMSDICAQAFLDAVDFPDFEAMIDGARHRSDLPADAWVRVDAVIRKSSQKDKLHVSFPTATARRAITSEGNS